MTFLSKLTGKTPEEMTTFVQNECLGPMPALPELAAALLSEVNIDPDMHDAILQVAARAEQGGVDKNAFHNPAHFAHVAIFSAYLLAHNPVPFTARENALVLLSAFAHDVDHPGKPNPADNICFNEEKSFQAILPILKECNLPNDDIDKIHTMILVTSPNGPHAYLRNTLKGNSSEHFLPRLSVLKRDQRLVEMAGILGDADILLSAGLGMTAHEESSRRLTEEVCKTGINVDFNANASRWFFFENIVGLDGFMSQSARAAFNENYADLCAQVKKALGI